MKTIGSLIIILIVLLIGAAIYNGMIRVDSDDTTTTIEMDTGRMGDAAKETVDNAVEGTKDLVSGAAEEIDEAVSTPNDNTVTP